MVDLVDAQRRPFAPDARWTDLLDPRTQVEVRVVDAATANLGAQRLTAGLPQGPLALTLSAEVSGLPPARIPDADALYRPVVHLAAYAGNPPAVVGIGRLCSFDRGLRSLGTVLVQPGWTGPRLAVTLVRPLVWACARTGMQRLLIHSAPDDRVVADLANVLGFRTTQDPDDPSRLRHTLSLSRGD